ncbi:MAG TPA: hypothetical protein VN451_01630, partial [Chitinophagaceae bacterium]|nr:hypothetical protein [Chitinophagaceae bacterium]
MKVSSNKILTIAVILLLLVNVAMLIFMFRTKKHHDFSGRGGKSAPVEYMAKELSMTGEQKNRFQEFRDKHFKSVRPLFDSIAGIRKTFFDLVRDVTANDSSINDFSKKIASFQAEIDREILAHFREVRSMFKGEQLEK